MSWKRKSTLPDDDSSDSSDSHDGENYPGIETVPPFSGISISEPTNLSKWNPQRLPSDSDSSTDSDEELPDQQAVPRTHLVDLASSPVLTDSTVQFLDACVAGDVNMAAEILEDGVVDVNISGDMQLAGLHVAVIAGKLKMVQWLVDHNASLSCRSVNGMTPLHYACEYSQTAIAIYLIRMGADISLTNKKKLSPLHFICITGNMQLAPHIPAYMINSSNADGLSLLHCAVDVGKYDIVEYLLDHGAEVSAKNTRGLTPLHLAASRGHISVAHLLVSRGAYWNCRDNNGTSPFHIACGAGRVEFMGYLMVCNCGVDARTNSGDTALHMACFSGSMDAAEILVNQIPRLLNSRNYIGDTPCDTCHNQGHHELLKWLLNRNGLRGDDLPNESEEDMSARLACERSEEEVRRRLEEEEQEVRVLGPTIIPTE